MKSSARAIDNADWKNVTVKLRLARVSLIIKSPYNSRPAWALLDTLEIRYAAVYRLTNRTDISFQSICFIEHPGITCTLIVVQLLCRRMKFLSLPTSRWFLRPPPRNRPFCATWSCTKNVHSLYPPSPIRAFEKLAQKYGVTRQNRSDEKKGCLNALISFSSRFLPFCIYFVAQRRC